MGEADGAPAHGVLAAAFPRALGHRRALPLWTAGDNDWLPVLRLPAYAPRPPKPTGMAQLPLFALEEVGT